MIWLFCAVGGLVGLVGGYAKGRGDERRGWLTFHRADLADLSYWSLMMRRRNLRDLDAQGLPRKSKNNLVDAGGGTPCTRNTSPRLNPTVDGVLTSDHDHERVLA